jgi:hypothetical protein
MPIQQINDHYKKLIMLLKKERAKAFQNALALSALS